MTDKLTLIDTDILVIGSGIAGLQAALTAAEKGQRVLLVSKSSVGKSNNTRLASGAFTHAGKQFSEEEHFQKTIESGRFLNDNLLVTCLVKRAPGGIKLLKKRGLLGDDSKRGFVFRTNELVGGPNLINVLLKACQEAGVDFLENVMVTDLLVENSTCRGAVGFHKRTGDFYGLRSGAVVLATGGAGFNYARNDNAPGTTGDGYALCLEAGLELRDMEFVQFYPLIYGGSGRNRMLLASFWADLGKILNRSGENIKEKYGLYERPVAVVCRDGLSQAMYREIVQGNAVEGALLLDLRETSEDEIPLSDDLKNRFKKKIAYDTTPVKIAPACHFYMGGVGIDTGGNTGLKGLFAAGEVAGGVHGANRMGGNALSEGLVFGELAGLSALEYAMSQSRRGDVKQSAEATIRKRGKVLKPGVQAGEKLAALTATVKQIMWQQAGIIRNGTGLQKGLAVIDDILEQLKTMVSGSPRELCTLFELKNALLCGKSTFLSAILRTESRGSHFREDYPVETADWMKTIFVHMTGWEITVSRMVPVGEKQ